MRKPKKEIQLLFLLSCCFMVARLLDEEISMYGYEGKENWEREQLPDKLSRSSTDERHGDPVYIQTVRGVGYRFNGNLGSE